MSEVKKEITTEEAVEAIQKAEQEKLKKLQEEMQELMKKAGYDLVVDHQIMFKKIS